MSAVERLKYVAQVMVSNVDKTSSDHERPVRLCNYADVYYNERITADLFFMEATATRDQELRFSLRSGDVLVTKDSETPDDIAVPARVREDLAGVVCGYHLAIIRPRVGRVDGTYLYWVMASLPSRALLSASANGITRFGLRQEAISDVPIPLPPLSAQRAIAGYLDRETARMDALIAAKRRMVELLEERYHVARIDLVVGRDHRNGKEGPLWLGPVPSDWTISRLKFLAKLDSGHTPNKQVDTYWVDCTIPWITLNDVSDLEADWRFYEPRNAVNELGLANSSAHVLPENAVVMSRDATVGRSALLGRPMAVSQHFVAWICGPEILPEYLLNVIRGPMQRHFGSLTAGATIATIGMPELNQLVVSVPPLETQERIVTAIASEERRARAMLGVLSRQIALIQERRQALITAAVTGELDIPEAA